jgi:hypothetical protein
VRAVAAVVAALSLVNVAGVFFVRETLHGSTTAYGLLDAAWTGALLVGGWLVATRAGSDRQLITGLMALLAASGLLILVTAGVPHLAWLVPLYLAGGVCNGAENTIGSLLIARREPAPAPEPEPEPTAA